MNYWLICLPREDLEHCIKIGTFGLGRKHVLGSVSSGDQVVCCAGKGDWKIIGCGEATGEYYLSVEKVFLKEGSFPGRFDFKANKLPEEQEVDIKQLLDQLSFVKDLAYWAVFFRNGIVKMTKKDWDLIKSQIGAAGTDT